MAATFLQYKMTQFKIVHLFCEYVGKVSDTYVLVSRHTVGTVFSRLSDKAANALPAELPLAELTVLKT